MEISISLWILRLKLSFATTLSELRRIRMDDASWHRQYILDRGIIVWMQFKQVSTLEEFKPGLHLGMLGQNIIKFRATEGEGLSLWRRRNVTKKILGWCRKKKKKMTIAVGWHHGLEGGPGVAGKQLSLSLAGKQDQGTFTGASQLWQSSVRWLFKRFINST